MIVRILLTMTSRIQEEIRYPYILLRSRRKYSRREKKNKKRTLQLGTQDGLANTTENIGRLETDSLRRTGLF